MKLKVNVDQRAALLAGIDAPTSTVMLDVDPAILTQEERDLVALLLHDGHDLTKYGYDVSEGTASNHWTAIKLDLKRPDLEGLKESLSAMRAKADADLAEIVAKKAKSAAENAEREAKVKADEVAAYAAEVDLFERAKNGTAEYHMTKLYATDYLVVAGTRLSRLDTKEYHDFCAAYIRAQEAQAEATKKKHMDTIIAYGTEVQRERVVRGWMDDKELQRLAISILTDRAMDGCPLPAYVPLTVDDVDLSDWDDDYDLPDVKFSQRKEHTPEDDDEATILLNAERIVKEWRKDAEVCMMRSGVTRDHDDIPYTWRESIKVTVPDADGGTRSRVFGLPE